MSCQQPLNYKNNVRCHKTDSLENTLSELGIRTNKDFQNYISYILRKEEGKNYTQEMSIGFIKTPEIEELLRSQDVIKLKEKFFEALDKNENVNESIEIQELLWKPDVIKLMQICSEYSIKNKKVNNSKRKNTFSLLGEIGLMLFMDRPIELISSTLIALFNVVVWTITCSTNAMCFIHRNLLYLLHPYPEELLVFAIDSFTNMVLGYPNEMEVPPIRELKGEVNGNQAPLKPSRSPSRRRKSKASSKVSKEASCMDINLNKNVTESPRGSAPRTPRSKSPVTEEPVPEDKSDPSKPRREEHLQACTFCKTSKCTKSESLSLDCSFCQAFKRTLAQQDDDEDSCKLSSLKKDIHQTTVKVMRTLYTGSEKS